jgi:hypothetical protein
MVAGREEGSEELLSAGEDLPFLPAKPAGDEGIVRIADHRDGGLSRVDRC